MKARYLGSGRLGYRIGLGDRRGGAGEIATTHRIEGHCPQVERQPGQCAGLTNGVQLPNADRVLASLIPQDVGRHDG